MTPLSGKSERELIRRIRGELGATRPVDRSRVPFGDDMAEMGVATGWLWTTDMLMDGVDFDSRIHDWHAIGRKAMAVNLSDAAAMAAAPISALCAVSLSDRMSMDDAVNLLRGARDAGHEHGCEIVGGDTNSWPHPTVIAITLAAKTPAGRDPVRRDGARPGDDIYVSGRLGGSIAGRHMTFQPRVALARELAAAVNIHAMIDISDGLALDLWRICEASDCGALLREALVNAATHSDAHLLSAKTARPPIEHALHDGEDFELLIALPSTTPREIITRFGLLRLGEFLAERRLSMRCDDGREIAVEARGWEHFK